ncbi:AAA family ATPase [Asaia sp. BMEF1]|uniref:AAA family ATPase n=1 Tax=Asaia sp. BMEF1 TaxID=3155932 RepID=UPI003F673E6C
MEPTTPSDATDIPAPLWQTIDVINVQEMEWLVPDVIPKKALICLYGAPNCGKTFLALHIALCLIIGVDCFPAEAADTPPKPALPAAPQRTVVYMLAEAPDSIGRRIAGWLEHFHYDRVTAQPIISQGLFASSHTHRVKLTSIAQIDTFAAELDRMNIHPDLIIFDPLISTLEGDENDASQMDRLITGMDALRQKFDCSIMVIHHPGKDARMIERGSSALRGGVDTHIAVHNEADLVDAEGAPLAHRIRLDIEKQREAPRSPFFYLSMHPIQGPLNARDRESKNVELGRAPNPSHAPTRPEIAASKHVRPDRKNTQRTRRTIPEPLIGAPALRPAISNKAYHEALRCSFAASKMGDGTFTKADVWRAHKENARKSGKKEFSEPYFYKVMDRVVEQSNQVRHVEGEKTLYWSGEAAKDTPKKRPPKTDLNPPRDNTDHQ